MRCRFGDCQPCYNGPEIVSEFTKSEASILREISTADTEALIGVVARYKD